MGTQIRCLRTTRGKGVAKTEAGYSRGCTVVRSFSVTEQKEPLTITRLPSRRLYTPSFNPDPPQNKEGHVRERGVVSSSLLILFLLGCCVYWEWRVCVRVRVLRSETRRGRSYPSRTKTNHQKDYDWGGTMYHHYAIRYLAKIYTAGTHCQGKGRGNTIVHHFRFGARGSIPGPWD